MRGDSQHAMALLKALMDSDVLKERANLLTSMLPELHAELALAFALAGDTDEADRRLETGRAHTSSMRVAVLALPRVIVLARRELWPLCLDFIANNRDGIRGLLRPHDARAVALVEAFALSQLSRDAYREAAAVRRIEDALQDSRAHQPGEFDYLGSTWPEMRAFLAAYSKDPPIESARR